MKRTTRTMTAAMTAMAVLLALALALAGLAGLAGSPANAQTCPQCHVNTTLTFKSTSGEEVTAPFLSDRCRLPGAYGSNHPAVCVGCGNSSNLVSCPTSDYGSLGSTEEGWCSDVLTDSQNCGSCGNSCHGGTCVNGQCTCDPSNPHSCGYSDSYFCNNVTNVVPKCEAYPTNKCPPTGLLPHNTSDFSVDLHTDAACWLCSDVCNTASNYTCVVSRSSNYECAQQCSQSKCPSDTPFCLAGACVQCRSYLDCLSGETCSPTTHTCVPGCLSNYDCLNPAKRTCDTNSNTCGQCFFVPTLTQNACPPKTFCSGAADTKNQCLPCPSGTYSLNMLFGNSSDCDSDLAVAHGRVQNCGGYDVPTDSPPHPALTCCHGTPKCGAFADPTNGTDAECGAFSAPSTFVPFGALPKHPRACAPQTARLTRAFSTGLPAPTTGALLSSSPWVGNAAAASACGEREYCDRAARKCMPLPFTKRFPFGNCKGYATDAPTSSTPYVGVRSLNQFAESALFCGTCDGSQAVVNPNNTDQATCPLFDRDACGASKKECGSNEACFNGKCTYFASSATNLLFAYDGYKSVRPQGLHGVSYQSDSSCTSTNSNLQLFSGWVSFFSGITNSFAYCANTAGVTSFSYSTIADPVARLAICPGGKDRCTPEFCTELFANVTKFQPTLCKAAGLVLGQAQRCMLGVRVPDAKTGDPVAAPSMVSQESTYDYCVYAKFESNPLQAALYGCMGVDAQNATVVDSATGVMPPSVMLKGCTSLLANVSPLSAAARLGAGPAGGSVAAWMVLAVVTGVVVGWAPARA